jgi:hypothetical protein
MSSMKIGDPFFSSRESHIGQLTLLDGFSSNFVMVVVFFKKSVGKEKQRARKSKGQGKAKGKEKQRARKSKGQGKAKGKEKQRARKKTRCSGCDQCEPTVNAMP